MANRIVSDPAVFGGAPCFAKTRIPVRLIAGALSAGDSVETILREYGGRLALADVLAAAWWMRESTNGPEETCRTVNSTRNSSVA